MISMSLQEKIRTDMVEAMKAKDALRLRVLRSVLSLFTQELVATKRTPRDELTDEEVLALIKRSVKQRKEASAQFSAGGRMDLAQNEDDEAEVLGVYLPEMLDRGAIKLIVEEQMIELGSDSVGNVGLLMKAVMTATQGRAEGKVVKEVIDEVISKK